MENFWARSRKVFGQCTIGIAAVVVAGCTSGPFGDPVPDPKIEDPNKGPGRKPFAA